MLDVRTATPCIVVAVADGGQSVDVQPAVSLVHRLEEARELPLPVIRGVPVMTMGSETLGLFVTVPLSPGDEGVLIVSDRALDAWQHGHGVARPPDQVTPRHHDLSDAMFYPGIKRAAQGLPSYAANAVQLRNRSGTVLASVSDTAASLGAPGASVVVTEGTVSLTGTLIINGAPYLGHVHGGVSSGGSNTSGVSS
jgi:hypothetical protein